MVWSESEEILPLLQDIQDFLASSRKRTVTEILDKVKAEILDKVKAGCIKVITAAMNIELFYGSFYNYMYTLDRPCKY